MEVHFRDLTRDLAQQWSGRRGIRVNAIAPGYFASEMTAEIPEDRLLPFVRQTSPLGRLGAQHELDAAVVFLASPASSYITGPPSQSTAACPATEPAATRRVSAGGAGAHDRRRQAPGPGG